MSAALPIIGRLTRTSANSKRIMPVNPDGRDAARIITELYDALDLLLKRHGEYIYDLPGETGLSDLDLAERALARARGEQ